VAREGADDGVAGQDGAACAARVSMAQSAPLSGGGEPAAGATPGAAARALGPFASSVGRAGRRIGDGPWAHESRGERRKTAPTAGVVEDGVAVQHREAALRQQPLRRVQRLRPSPRAPA